MELLFQTRVLGSQADTGDIRDLLAAEGLDLEADVEVMITARRQDRTLVGCAGLARDVVKCVAVSPDARGEGLALPLMTEVIAAAWEMGRKNLFLYTKPDNAPLFAGCGFIELARVPDAAVLMENNKHRLADYVAALAEERRPGARIAGLVMNCNPFTLGHRYLVDKAAAECDWVHVFVVREDVSEIPYQDRLDLVRQGAGHLANVTVHPGSVYVLSRATFPQYFLKDKARVDQAYTGLDLQIFRQRIAPALGVTHRYVGTEPLSAVTGQYNRDMEYWLTTPDIPAPAISLVEVPRLEKDGRPISASLVRSLWAEKGAEAVRHLVPESTYRYLQRQPGCPGRNLTGP